MRSLKSFLFFLTTIFCVCCPGFLFGQSQDSIPFHEMSLEQLMDVNVTVASHLPMNARQSPGVLTILTQEEIRNSGAKDIIDLLRIMVPGFDFAVDVQGTIGLGVRGNWGAEGKVLMLWDGMELNEELYSTLQFGAHYPISQIYQMEIIRGPGSAMYGGYAEYAVINVISINNKNLNGLVIDAANSQMSKTYGTRSFMIAGGKDIGNSHINLSANINRSNRSQGTYTDYNGNAYDMTNSSAITTNQFRADYYYKNLSVNAMWDQHTITTRDGYDAIYKEPSKIFFNSLYGNVKYDLKYGKHLFTPGFKIKYNQPYCFKTSLPDDILAPYNTTAVRQEYYLNGSFLSESFFDINYGFSYNHIGANQNLDSTFFSNGEKRLAIENYAAYLQGTFNYKNYIFVAGTRYNLNSRYPSAFVPRLALTATFDQWHAKALFSKGFRAPSVENINSAPGIKPENTTVSEFEIGKSIGKFSYLTANVFSIHTDDPIVFFYDSLNVDSYRNDTTVGSKGFEIEYKIKDKNWYSTISYSYFRTRNFTEEISVPGVTNAVRAFPNHKLTFVASFAVNNRLHITPSLLWLSTRFSATESSSGITNVIRFKPESYLNLNIRYEHAFVDGLTFELGCFNITDRPIVFIQPYNGNHSPLPGSSREIQLKVTYRLSAQK